MLQQQPPRDFSCVRQVLALYAFVSMCAYDLAETWQMHSWLKLFPTQRSWSPLLLQEFWDWGHLSDEELWENGSLKRIHFEFCGNSSFAGGLKVRLPAMGVTCSARCYFYCAAIGVKVVVAVAVMLAGAGAVLHSDNNFDLVLNSVAATFVLQLDEHFFTFFVSDAIKKASSGVPPLHVPARMLGSCGTRARVLRILCGTYMAMGVTALLSYVLYQFYWCSSLDQPVSALALLHNFTVEWDFHGPISP